MEPQIYSGEERKKCKQISKKTDQVTLTLKVVRFFLILFYSISLTENMNSNQ